MLSSDLIIHIIVNNYYEFPKYRKIFINKRVITYIQKILSTELFKWKYFVYSYPYYKQFINKGLLSKCLKVVRYCINMGATAYTTCLSSNNMDIVLEGLKYTKSYDYCLLSDNLDVVKLGISLGATEYDFCLLSSNIDVVKLGVSLGATGYNSCLNSKKLEIAELGVSLGAKDYDLCLLSSNIDVVKLGISLGANSLDWCMSNKNIDVVNYAVSLGAENYKLCLHSSSIDVIKIGVNKCNTVVSIGASDIKVMKYCNKMKIPMYYLSIKHIDGILYSHLSFLN